MEHPSHMYVKDTSLLLIHTQTYSLWQRPINTTDTLVVLLVILRPLLSFQQPQIELIKPYPRIYSLHPIHNCSIRVVYFRLPTVSG